MFAIQDGGPPAPDLTGCYEFAAAGRTGCGRFSRWFLEIDQAQKKNSKKKSKATAGAAQGYFKCGIDVRHDGRAIMAHHLAECPRDMWTDGGGSENFLGQDDPINHVRGAQTAVLGHLVAPVADLDPLRLRSEQAFSGRREHDARQSAKHLNHQSNSGGPGQGRPEQRG